MGALGGPSEVCADTAVLFMCLFADICLPDFGMGRAFAEVRNEVARVAGAAQDLAPEVEQASSEGIDGARLCAAC